MKRLISKVRGSERFALSNHLNAARGEPDGLGLNIVWTPELEQPAIDIVFVHGLNGGSRTTWTSGQIFWPRDLLPSVIPTARILTFGYNANLWFNTAEGDVYTFAENLLAALKAHRNGTETRPIMFVGHSMGGIVIKRALVQAQNRETFRTILHSTAAVVFMGTPHQGSQIAGYATIINKLWASVRGGSFTASVSHLESFSSILRAVNTDFIELAPRLAIVSFYEQKPIPYIGLIVEFWSSRLNQPNETCVGIDSDHREICRFSSADDPRFKAVYEQLICLVNNAGSEQYALRRTSAQRDGNALVSPAFAYTPPSGFGAQRRSISTFSNVPAFSRKHFFQREPELAEIRGTFNRELSEGLCVHCLYGIGGVGKTQFALEFACEVMARDHPGTVFWFQASQAAQLLEQMDEVVSRISPQREGQERKRKAEALFLEWLSEQRNWLIILDNVDSIATVRSIWPPSQHGRILMTTRDPGIISPQLGNYVRSTRVQPLCVKEGADFLQTKLGLHNTNRNSLEELTTLLGGLPIALSHAIGYLNNTDSTLEELLALEDMRKMRFQLLDEHDAESANFNYELRFNNIFEQSLKSLMRHEVAVRLLHFLVMLNTDAIEESLVRTSPPGLGFSFAWYNTGLYNGAISELKKRSLVEKDAKKGTLKIHRLVRWAVVRSWSAADWTGNFDSVFRLLESCFPRQVDGGSIAVGRNRDQCSRIAPHVQALEIAYTQGKHYLGQLMGFAELLAHCGYYLYERGLNKTAFDILQSAREVCQKEMGETPNLTHALVLNNLAVIHSIRNEPRKALKLNQQVVEWRKELLGEHSTVLANSLCNLATNHYDLDELVEAKISYAQALSIYENTEGASEELLGVISSNAGRNLLRLDELEEAERLLTRSLKIQRRLLGDDHYFTTATVYRLVNLRLKQGRVDEARTLVDRCLSYRKQLLGEFDPRVGVAYHKRASILRRQGHAREASEDVKAAIQAFEKNEANCESGLVIRSRFLLAFILSDMERENAGDDVGTPQSVKEMECALASREMTMSIPRDAPHAREDDIDTLVQPDFR